MRFVPRRTDPPTKTVAFDKNAALQESVQQAAQIIKSVYR